MSRTKILLGKHNHQLGDTIGWMGQVEKYQRAFQEEVHVFCNFSNLFGASNLHIHSVEDPLWHDSFDKKFIIDFYPNTRERPSSLTNKIHHIKESGLIQTASEILGFDKVEEIKPTISFKPKSIKTKKPIVTLASLSTMQQKMWNYKNGWNEVISYLKKNRIDVVSIDRYARFGAGYPLRDIPAFNPIPSRSIDRTGGGLRIAASYIKKSIFHMGLSSGLSWLAWALDKSVVSVVGHNNQRYDFSSPYRIQNTSVCHACWDNHDMNAEDWYWCPENKNFECTTQITPEMVIEKINIILNQ